jgi:hypothetical protein
LKAGPDKKEPRRAEEVSVVLVLVFIFRNGFSIKLVSKNLTGIWQILVVGAFFF